MTYLPRDILNQLDSNDLFDDLDDLELVDMDDIEYDDLTEGVEINYDGNYQHIIIDTITIEKTHEWRGQRH